MAKYLREFATQQEYEAYINGNPDLPNVSLVDEDESVKYNEKPHDYSKYYLTFTALEDGTFKLSGNTVNYSLDGGETWVSLPSNTNTPTVHSGETIMFKAQLTPTSMKGIGTFSSTGQYEVEGNAMSLLYGDNFVGKTDLTEYYAIKKLFKDNTGLTSANNLVLPATTLTYQCYLSMFEGCTSLTTAPELHATTLAFYCYNGMFRGCTSLNYIKMLAADISAEGCLSDWVQGVSQTGTFVKAASATIPTGTSGIPSGWTVQDA